MAEIVSALIAREEARQREMIGLIPSENHSSPEVQAALASCLSSKYSEGYPARRYYEGNQVIDELEALAIERTRALFGVPYANVQPYSGSPANSAILFALLEPGDVLLGLGLRSEGHLTHGHPRVTFSGRYFRSVQYGVDREARIDFDALARIADEHRPRAIIAGEHPSPVPHCDVVMTTTRKTLRGPRGAAVLVTERGLERDPGLCEAMDAAVFPGLQGGPHDATTAAIAVAAEEAARPEFAAYARRIRVNADALADGLLRRGMKLVGNGTENHLMVLDLTGISPGLGTPLVTTRGMKDGPLAGLHSRRGQVARVGLSPLHLVARRLVGPERTGSYCLT